MSSISIHLADGLFSDLHQKRLLDASPHGLVSALKLVHLSLELFVTFLLGFGFNLVGSEFRHHLLNK